MKDFETLTVLTLEDVLNLPTRSAIAELKRPDDPEFASFNVDPASEDAPNEIFWRGRQWAVTDYGVETWRNAPYHCYLAYDDLIHDRHVFDHIAEKGWADPVDFLHASAIALQRVAKLKP